MANDGRDKACHGMQTKHTRGVSLDTAGSGSEAVPLADVLGHLPVGLETAVRKHVRRYEGDPRTQLRHAALDLQLGNLQSSRTRAVTHGKTPNTETKQFNPEP